ncbi:MAG: c-type cytochrome, partial [Cyclobacteriaceae bacterium]|nr:c-type cytochrome [Cyclobacteriaceae bacterium]
PALDNASVYGADPYWRTRKTGFAIGLGWNVATGHDPTKPTVLDSLVKDRARHSKLIAWDPIGKRQVWKVDHPTYWNGGVLTTASSLVFQGTSDGRFVAFDGVDGTKLWETSLDIGVIAAPVTYLVDGIQYVTIVAGWGGGVGQKTKFTKHIYPGTIFTYALGKKAPNPNYPEPEPKQLIDLELNASEEEIKQGAILFNTYCALCHASIGSGGGNIPDLGYSTKDTYLIFHDIVREGLLLPLGMPNFGERLSDKEVSYIKNYIIASAKKKRI